MMTAFASRVPVRLSQIPLKERPDSPPLNSLSLCGQPFRRVFGDLLPTNGVNHRELSILLLILQRT